MVRKRKPLSPPSLLSLLSPSLSLPLPLCLPPPSLSPPLPPPNIPHMRTSNKLPNERLSLAALAHTSDFLTCKSLQTQKLQGSRNKRHVRCNLRRLWEPWTIVGFRNDFILTLLELQMCEKSLGGSSSSNKMAATASLRDLAVARLVVGRQFTDAPGEMTYLSK